jgi:uncharacterized protein
LAQQLATGIPYYKAIAKRDASSEAEKLLLSRRLELQADCLAAVALSAMPDAVPPQSQFESQFDYPQNPLQLNDHGLRSTRKRWFIKGFSSGKPGACNTWIAPEQDVT